MVALTCTVERRGDTALVELVVTNESPVARRVRIANRLAGPVWPPRVQGVPETGWDDGGFEGVVDPGERLALGYASPGEPTDPPAEISWSERAACHEVDDARKGEHDDESVRPSDSTWDADEQPTPMDVVRSLGDSRPPHDAVRPSGRESKAEEPSERARDDGGLPAATDAWLAEVEARIEQGNALAEATTLVASARAIEEVGSLPAVERLVENLGDDVEDLRRVERRAAALAGLADEAAETVPLETFRRLS